MSNLIQLSNICKTYHTGKVAFEALKNINLTINSGEYISILGPSGSGKSTLMQIVGCLSTPTSGSYQLDGKEVSQLKRNELAAVRGKKIGFVFQSFNLLPQTSLIDNVSLPLLYQGMSSSKREARAKELIGKAVDGVWGNGHADHKPPVFLQPGEGSRLGINGLVKKKAQRKQESCTTKCLHRSS